MAYSEEGFRYWLDDRPEWFCDKVTSNEIITHPTHCDIQTPQGTIQARVGDWVVRAEDGRIFVAMPGESPLPVAWR